MKRHLPAIGAGMAAFALAARVLWNADSAGTGMNLLLDAAAFLAAGTVLAGCDRVAAPRAALAWAGLGAWGLLSTFWAGEKLPAALTGSQWLAAAALGFAAANGARAAFLHALCAAGAFASGLAVWQYTVGLPRLREAVARDPSLLDRYPEAERWEFMTRLYTDEPFAPFQSSNVLCAFLAIALCVLVGKALDATSKRDRALVGLAALPLAFAAVLTKSTGGFLAIAAAAAVFAWRAVAPEAGPRRTRLGLAGLGAGVLASLVLLAARPGPFDWKNPRSSLGVRRDYAAATLEIAKAHPALGVGASNWSGHYTRHIPPTGSEAQRAHADALQVLSETGPLGLALLLAVPVFALVAALRPRADGPAPEPSSGVLPASAGLGAAALLWIAVEPGTDLVGALPAAALAAFALFAARRISHGPFTAAGALAGLVAFFTHGLIEYDLYVPGVACAAAALAASFAPAPGRLPGLAAAGACALAAAAALVEAPAFLAAEGRAAEGRIDEARESDPWDAGLAERQAHARIAKGAPSSKVLEAYDAAISLAPHQAGLRYQRGRFLLERREPGALDDLRKAVELYPNSAVYRYWLGKARREAGDGSWRDDWARALLCSDATDLPRRQLTREERIEVEAGLR